jgi:NitT/TauT family transport system ATP-binding protein
MMDDTVLPAHLLPSYLEQDLAVRARFEALKAREVILAVSHLHKVFASHGKSTTALKDINFTTHRREFVCVVGPNTCRTGGAQRR